MDEEKRDGQGRFLPGVSGNPAGRGPGRPSDAVNDLADEAVTEVLQRDLGILRGGKATAKARQQSLDRLARLGARRITSEGRVVVGGEEVARLVSIITRHVQDPAILAALANELEELP